MSQKKQNIIIRLFKIIIHGLNYFRLLVVNLFFLFILGLIFFAFTSGKEASLPTVPDKTALVIHLNGQVVDELDLMDPFKALMGEVNPRDQQTRLRDVITAINTAANDDRITMIVLRQDYLLHAGISKMQELSQALINFKSTGKKVIAYGNTFTQDSYFLASFADEIYMHPMGGVLLQGYGVYRSYYKEALDKMSVNMHIFRVGEFKSALEPFFRDDMSDDAKRANKMWLSQLWGQYTETVTQNRQLKSGSIDQFINQLDKKMQAYKGNTAMLAVSEGLIDDLKTRQELNQYLIEQVGVQTPKGHYQGIPFKRYLTANKTAESTFGIKKEGVGIIVASGNIVDGKRPPGSIGGDSTAALIRKAERDANVRALVLRVDSGGGSAFASEIIRDALLAFKATGKPLVVSMGSAAASGGYWISANADKIIATPTTLTGSIGIFGAFPTLEKSLEKLGVRSDGVGTTDLAGAMQLNRDLPDLAKNAIQSGIEHGYDSFIKIVAEGRDLPLNKVKQIAEGRVWSGLEAQRLGLVDNLGYLEDAITVAATLAELDTPSSFYVEPDLTPQQAILKQLENISLSVQSILGVNTIETLLNKVLGTGVFLQQPVDFFQQMNDPNHRYIYCDSCIKL